MSLRIVEQRRGTFLVAPAGEIVGAIREEHGAWLLYHGPERRRTTELRASGWHDAVLEAIERSERA